MVVDTTYSHRRLEGIVTLVRNPATTVPIFAHLYPDYEAGMNCELYVAAPSNRLCLSQSGEMLQTHNQHATS